jgi:homoserine acetyltransferase
MLDGKDSNIPTCFICQYLADALATGDSVKHSIDTSYMKLRWDLKISRTSWSTSGKNGLVPKVSFDPRAPGCISKLTDAFEEPENLLVLLQTWQNGDVSQQEPYNGDFEKAMASIKAKALVLPSKTDLYFP